MEAQKEKAGMKQPYDPKLREAAEEYKALCAKHNIAGVALFCSATHSEYVHVLTPSWGVMRAEGTMLRFRSKREDWPTKEAQNAATEASAHILTSMVEWSRQLNTNTRSIIDQLSKHARVMWRAWDKPDSTPGDGL